MSDGTGHLSKLVWSGADLLRGDFKSSEYGRVILPFTVLRRLDCLLAPSRQAVLDEAERTVGEEEREQRLAATSGWPFYNSSRFSMESVLSDPENADQSLLAYVNGYSQNVRELLEGFEFERTVTRLSQAGLLYRIVAQFVAIDLGQTITDDHMEGLFEELVRRFAESGNEVSGEHYTPRDVAHLMAGFLVSADSDVLTTPHAFRSILDPACGTAGLLTEAASYIASMNPRADVALYGQEINRESWAISRATMMTSGRRASTITFGNVFAEDGHQGTAFDYLLANPPFGVSWKKSEHAVRSEHEELGFAGRFGAGLPRINDGSLLFLQHMLAKMKPVSASGEGGSRIAVIFNGSPMYVGGAGSGESDIRRWIVENDWLEAVVALPDLLFPNTGINTYLWVLSNRKPAQRRGQVLLLNAQDQWQKLRRSVGSKRKYITSDQIAEITGLYLDALSADPAQHPDDRVRVVSTHELMYQRVTVDQPLRLRYELSEEVLTRLAESRLIQKTRDPAALVAALRPLVGSTWTRGQEAVTALRRAVASAGVSWPRGKVFEAAVRKAVGMRDRDGEPQRIGEAYEPDPELREFVHLPLQVDPSDHLRREVHPTAPDAWIDDSKTRVGCEIPPALFYRPELDGEFELLRNLARLETTRVHPPQRGEEQEDGTDRPKHLRAQDLHEADSAVELPDAPEDGLTLTLCSGGMLVGRPGNWRLLPQGFGEAATSLFVLQPLRGSGQALCEWLNSRKDNGLYPSARDLLDTHVPVDLVTDSEVESLLETVQEGRRALRTTMSGILPNVFGGGERDVQGVRNEIRAAAHEAGLIGELVRPLDDPISRAEWSFPYHAAALSRRYRVSTHPAERKDGLLKLGEGLARVLGVLAFTELAASNGFSRNLRKQFRTGATFGTWLWILDRLEAEGITPRIQQLATVRDRGNARVFLGHIKDFRNTSHHAHGVRASHQLAEDVERLEPHVVRAISAVSWLSGTHWDWVERCEYLDEGSYRIVGLRLRGSHPSWEPFERSSTQPLRPDRIYVDSAPYGAPVDLWPFAVVSLCEECRTRELFLLNEVRGDQLSLRSLEEHSLEMTYGPPE
ncbi:class I SAM-dependent DNA methyltransferase [Streptomyces sp. NPDC046409]|uniref:type I restriction-modification system subunit M n=1 Tax=Streptomyces sp. NPDC046409 TaxID=3156675 RepID=UPI0033C9CA4A